MEFQREGFIEKVKKDILKYGGKINQDTLDIGPGHLTVLAALSIPAFFFTKYFVAFGLMVLTLTVSIIMNTYDANRLGIETATFSTVTMGMVFPPRVAALLALIYISLQMFSGSNPGIYLIWVIPSYVTAGFLIGNLSHLGVVQAGILTSVALQSLFVFMTFMTSRSRLPKFIQYVIFNLTFNFFMFKTFAQPLIGVIG